MLTHYQVSCWRFHLHTNLPHLPSVGQDFKYPYGKLNFSFLMLMTCLNCIFSSAAIWLISVLFLNTNSKGKNCLSHHSAPAQNWKHSTHSISVWDWGQTHLEFIYLFTHSFSYYFINCNKYTCSNTMTMQCARPKGYKQIHSRLCLQSIHI